ncbi:hypothetical protein [Solitalea canadensis]|uniref:DUF4595 domain-containing protein n=1 Tax=Solitalea canadensis (strain ATCC 29591 / DSM 3403 / JCM 21819 / LMG 8368 / NBRC 15130 / NCIMB 12057 / USAM 9D) TaxID=929556 RepID=H8KTB1_SOLCM|nr:hypothetical protein [Solitalea canadensis]AFD06248.1 hypothetical protein Solca_1144 [Solitalea canadensis DSM 3403]
MKTLSIYSILLTMLIMACQKDTDESPLSSEKKKDHCNKCPTIYLPKTYSEAKYSFTYKDSTGNLATIVENTYMKVHFIYGNNNRIEKLQWMDDDGVLYDNYELTYTGNKLTKLTKNYSGGYTVDNYTIRWDGDKIKNLVIRRVEDSQITNRDSIIFSYNSDNSIAGYEFYDPNQKELTAGYSFSYKSSEYKYWAKDIKNKEIIFLALIDSSPKIVPASNDISSILKYEFTEYGQNFFESTYHDQQYNEANYPLTYGKTYRVSDEMEQWVEESQQCVSYIKVNK